MANDPNERFLKNRDSFRQLIEQLQNILDRTDVLIDDLAFSGITDFENAPTRDGSIERAPSGVRHLTINIRLLSRPTPQSAEEPHR